jgi:hypothetical protein
MGTSERVIAVVGAGLLIATAGGCSRGEADKAEAPAPTTQATRQVAERLESAIPGLTFVALSELPRSPESGAVDEYCEGYRAETLTATGRAVQAKGWVVTSEATLGRYRVVSFVSGFQPGTSAMCFSRNGNIAVYDGTRLMALAYAMDGDDRVPVSVEPMENGALLIWGDTPGLPLGEMHLDGDRPRLTGIAAERAYCGGTAVVPNVYGKSIGVARTTLIARGWKPAPPSDSEAEHSGAERLTRQGVIEAQACSGTGVGYCAFRYEGAAGTLGVTTVGEYDRVMSYSLECRR